MKKEKVIKVLTIILVILLIILSALAFMCFRKSYRVILTAESINPIYPNGLNSYSVKDATVVYKDGLYYIFASAFYENDGRIRTHLLGVSTPDFVNYGEPFVNRYGEELDVIGLASPEVTFFDGLYYMVYNNWGDKEGMPNQLFYAVSENLVDWDFDKTLAKNLTDGRRCIDAAIHFMNGKVYLVYKEKQTMKFAVADSIDGDFTPIKSYVYEWYENYGFVEEDGVLYMYATDILHNPALLSIKGDKTIDENFGKWKLERRFILPKQAFNTNERANAASITYIPEQERFLMVYAGRTENKTNLGRGNNQLGLAESNSLLGIWKTL